MKKQQPNEPFKAIDESFYNLTKTFILEILDYFDNKFTVESIPNKIVLSYNPVFDRLDDNGTCTFFVNSKENLVKDYSIIILENRDLINNLDSFQECKAFLDLISQPVKRLESLFENFLTSYLELTNSFVFNLGIFDEVYHSLEKIVFKIPVKIRTIAIIPGLDVKESNVVLNEHLSITPFCNEKFNKVYTHTSEKNYLSLMLLATEGKASFIEFTNETKITSEFILLYLKPIIPIRNLVTCLRLFKKGDICIVNYVHYTDNLIVKSGSSGSLDHKVPDKNIGKNLIITKQELNNFINFYNLYSRNAEKFSPFFKNAISRFNGIWFRKGVEDVLVDLIIAFESLFLNNNPEISFRLPFSVAYFVAISTKDRKEIYSTMREAYKLRSKTVHGSNSRNVDKNVVQISEILEKIEDYLRRSIKRMILEKTCSISKNKFLKQIEDLILNQEIIH